MKRLFVLFAFILSFSIVSAQETYRFRTDAPQGISIESSSATGLALHYSLSEIGIADVENGGVKGQEIILKGSFGSIAEGMPSLPFENYYIAVPQGAKVSVEVNEKASMVIEDIDLLPVAELQMNDAPGAPVVRKDMSVFGKDADFPSHNVGIAQSTEIRGLDVVLLNVTPFRYNPVRKTLEVIYDIDIEVRFEGGIGRFGEPRYRNPDWDRLLRDLVINSDMLPEADYYDLINIAEDKIDIGCEYLIIAPDDDSILAWADTLRRFRNRQGVLTKVVTPTECGGNYPEAIKAYIHNAYDNWVIPPAAVMIFGGMTDTLVSNWPMTYGGGYYGIPGFPLLFLKYDYENGTIMDFNYHSDNPYVDMNDDSIPDMAISRLSAFTYDEYRMQVQKLIDYETHPTVDPHFYDHPIITAGHEANKWFLLTSQLVDGFYRTKLGRHPTNLYMMYDDELPRPDTVWSTGQFTETVVDYFGPNGENYIAGDPSGLDHWVTKENTELLFDAINEETFLTLYRDHSATDYWCCPFFHHYDIHALQNATPTFILSIGCDAANYELSYSLHYDGWMGRSVITEFCNTPVGALGGIGATTVTRSHFNDRITWGILDYIWPEFMPTLASSSEPAFVRPSYALVAGKLFLTQGAFMADWWPDRITETHNVFHYLGDAYLNLYTEVPQDLHIKAPLYHADNQWQYSFTAEEGALVCLSSNGEILQAAIATGLPQSLTLPQMAVGEQFLLTATKQNRFRFEQTVTVIAAQEPYVYVKSFGINDHDGNGQLDYDETAAIDLDLDNAGLATSPGGTVRLLCESPYVEILQGTAAYSRIEADAELTLHDAFRIRLLPDVPDQTRIRFNVQFNEGQSTHHDVLTVTANAPVLRIEPEYHPMTADGEPSTHIATEGRSKITFTMTNKGHSTTKPMNASLDIKAPFVEVENPRLQLESLAPKESLPLTFSLNATPNAISGAWLQSHLAVQHMEQFVELDTIVQYGGIFENFESDVLNPLLTWITSNPNPWTYCYEDAYEGLRCYISESSIGGPSVLRATWNGDPIGHPCKISFQYKTDNDEVIWIALHSSWYLSSDEWQYGEIDYNGFSQDLYFCYEIHDGNSVQAKIDDLCFPPTHTAIAYAGDDIIACDEVSVVALDAYAYDCDAILWTTEGDGYFGNDTVVNTLYYPGSQDIANGGIALTLTANGNGTMASTMQIHFVDEVELGEITGDSIVNKYENPVSHYSIENEEGLSVTWTLEPSQAGTLYGFGDVVSILWNLHEGDMETTLWATTDSGCTSEPVAKRISLIGYSTPEWHPVDFNLFPNPTDGKVDLVIGETLQGKAVVEVYNLLGERMMAKKIGQLQQGETLSLDLSRLVSGLYIIKLSTENGSCSKKVSVW
jgi:hypothetical protein